MQILLGAPVWYGNRPFSETLRKLQQLDLDYIEFSLDYPLPDSMSNTEREELLRLLEDYGIRIGFHSPLDTPVAHPRDDLAEAGLRIVRSCMAFSATFHPRTLYYNFHLPVKIPTYKLEDVRPQIQQRMLACCEALTQAAMAFSLTGCVENELTTCERSELLHDALSHFYPRLQFTLDIGHAIKAEVYHTKTKELKSGEHFIDYLTRWVDRCGQKLLVTHVHDCACVGSVLQDHLSLGRGTLDLERVFKLLKSTSCRYLLIETFWKSRKKEAMDYDELKRNVELVRSYW
ncbi:MAG: sugar phosphate isomerase/epimerase [Methanomicrobia archaeon]|nr:sugar phosphate isomerase/epimerase [Methanomicrobia archaeon]